MLRIRTDLLEKQLEFAQIIHVTENTITYNTVTITLDSIKQRNDFKSFCRFVFPLNLSRIKNTGHRYLDPNTGKEYEMLIPTIPFDLYSQTYNSKHNALSHLHMLKTSMFCIFYPETKNFKDALLFVTKQTEASPLIITTENDKGEIVPYVPEREEFFSINDHILPKCTLTSDSKTVPLEGTNIVFAYRDINGIPKEVDFIATVKTDKGYITHNNLDVTDGIGIFKFIPLGLNTGEKVKVEVGIGNFSNICNVELTVG